MALTPRPQAEPAQTASAGCDPSSAWQPQQQGAALNTLAAPRAVAARPGAPSLADLEPELLGEIATCLRGRNLDAARLACRGLDAAARARCITALRLSPRNTLRRMPRRLVTLDDAGQLHVGEWQAEDADEYESQDPNYPFDGWRESELEEMQEAHHGLPGGVWEYSTAVAGEERCYLACSNDPDVCEDIWDVPGRVCDPYWMHALRRPDWRRLPALRTLRLDGWCGCKSNMPKLLWGPHGWQEGGDVNSNCDDGGMEPAGAAAARHPALPPLLTPLAQLKELRIDLGYDSSRCRNFWDDVIGGALRAAPNVARLELEVDGCNAGYEFLPGLHHICAYGGGLTALHAKPFDLYAEHAAQLLDKLPRLRDLTFDLMLDDEWSSAGSGGGPALPVERLTALDCNYFRYEAARLPWVALRTLRVCNLRLEDILHLSASAPVLATLHVDDLQATMHQQRLAAACFPALRCAHLGVSGAYCPLAIADLARMMPGVEQLGLAGAWGWPQSTSGRLLRSVSLSGLQRLRTLTLTACGCAAGLLGLGGACCQAGVGVAAGGSGADGGAGGDYGSGGGGSSSSLLGPELERAPRSVELPQLGRLSCQLCCAHAPALSGLSALSTLVLAPITDSRNADGSPCCAACAALAAAFSEPAPLARLNGL